jgi:DNA mismatch repair protein MutL
MDNIIHLLPDKVANQIAAGEVIQRPASVVKELLENAIDAGADKIDLIVKDAGRTLIQVVDNGKGMSFADARMCFERHATSKITSAEDLNNLKTKGFRGEALASIAAIAHVQLKTRQQDSEIGTCLVIEGTEVKEHVPFATAVGTSIAVKNLFFNVPARRNFLKSDSIELGHIEEELNRVALIHHDVAFTMTHNDKICVQVAPSNFKQRIVNLFGLHFKDKLYPLELKTEQVQISGFIAKPENAKKKKSERYLFINNRFVKHYLLNYAIENAYIELIPKGYKPAYFISMYVKPETIDVNVSPTKIEVKLQDEKLIFGFLQSTVKKSIGTLTLTPRFDFEHEKSFDFDSIPKNQEALSSLPYASNPNFNPFEKIPQIPSSFSNSVKYDGRVFHSSVLSHSNSDYWENFLEEIKQTKIVSPDENKNNTIHFEKENFQNDYEFDEEHFLLLEHKYLLLKLSNKLACINIIGAYERILYEKYKFALDKQPMTIQQSLFPTTISLSSANAELLREVKAELSQMGYDIESVSNVQFAVNGTPLGEDCDDIQGIIEQFLESYKSNSFLQKGNKNQIIALSMARQKRTSIKTMTHLTEIQNFISQLFACQVADRTPDGKKIVAFVETNSLEKLF